MNSPQASKQTWQSLGLRALLALGIAVLMMQVNLDYLESYLYDIRVRSTALSTPEGPLEIIYINQETIQNNKGFPSASIQQKLLEKLKSAGALAVIYDFDIRDSLGSESELNAWEASIVKGRNIYVAGRSTPLKGEEDLLWLADPLEQIFITPSPKTTDLVNFAKDGVTRRMILTYQDRPLLPVTIAGLLNPSILDPRNTQGSFDFYGTQQGYINFYPARSFPSSNFDEALLLEPERFQNKIVLIGTDLGLDENEYVLTPFSRSVMAMTRAELQANTINTLIQNNGYIRLPSQVTWGLVIVAALITIHVVFTLSPTRGLTFLGLSILGFTVLNFVCFWGFRWWLPMAAPLLTIILSYYLFIPYRLIVESRRSWEYYQKNKLLKQVEELKTNFISMMSHDLKTPLARILGMTDVILSDTTTISASQREAVDTIRHSSDDLLKFINAILNYGRIESEGVTLNLQTKDINQLLEEVSRKHEFLAKIKNIRLVLELEPLFPISADPELLKQVFSNLIENAIKYSPEGTKVLISSEEQNHKVIIQVADQGAGIPQDELQSIFMKFFRSKNVKSSPIKGSGLGLYLAKYFTELHHGMISVESSHGKGSTFTVELPISQGGENA